MTSPSTVTVAEVVAAVFGRQSESDEKAALKAPGAAADGGAPVLAKTDTKPPVSKERLRVCMESATYWASELPRYASRQQNKADAWAIAAGVLAAITGLSIFPTADSNVGTWAKVGIAAGAFLAAVFALVPRVKNYAEMAGAARELAAVYGPLKGQLIDAVAEMESGNGSNHARLSVVVEFEGAKAKKDKLRYLPLRPQ